MKTFYLLGVRFLILFGSVLFGTCLHGQKTTSTLEAKFKNPPEEVRPRTWYHVMNGNMSKVGVTKDLKAMADTGIGGIILFNVSHRIPQGNVTFNSPEHIEMIGHAAAECERLGLSFGVHNCDGWTSSGGPWVTPEHSMKQVVFNETITDGGEVNLMLDIPSQRGSFYQDIAVVAYPAFASEINDATLRPKLSSSNPDLNLAILTDGRIDKKTFLKADGNTSWIQFDYQQPFTLRSLYINFEKAISAKGKVVLQNSKNGIDFDTVSELKLLRQGKKEHGIDMPFDGITSRFFRIQSEIALDISEIKLSSTQRFNNMLARTSLYKLENHRIPEIKASNKSMIVQKKDIINLSDAMTKNGQLTTHLPEGKWTIMRFGYTITGAMNSPASDAGRGWEVDKMSRESFKTFYDGYVKNVIDISRPVAPNALQYIEIDSYEVGGQNWTKDYENQFNSELGYNILDYLPLYAGRYIDDTKTTEHILWDIRNFNSKMMTDNYFDYFTELCHEDGLISYIEPYSFNASFNELDAARKVDIPMGEFWMHQRYQTETAVSGARIYGKNIVSAESFSARPEVNWKSHPGSLKLTGDKAWTLGINEFMFHRYAHQANTNVAPGMTMSQWGSHIDRTQTWWDNAGKSWFKYLARGQFMLRQGIPVSRVLTFVGDGSPNSIVKRSALELPNHINFDCVNADALLNRITSTDGKLVFPDGLTYDVLQLFNTKEIHLSTLKKIAELSKQGVIIIGEKPERLGGYKISKEDKKAFITLVDTIWNSPSTYVGITDWDDLFKKHNIPLDLFIEDGEDINYIHRKTAKEDIYFFFNPDTATTKRTYRCTFNVDGKIPELWNQMTGKITKLSAFKHENGKTFVDITLPAEGSTFVVFRETSDDINSIQPNSIKSHSNIKASLSNNNSVQFEINKNGKYNFQLKDGNLKTISVKDLPEALDIPKDWEVTFPDMKSKDTIFSFSNLIDWTTHEIEGIKYYSGTATYAKTFNIKDEMFAEAHKITIDLGQVNIAARVILNGKDLGVLWKAPFTVDATSALKKGKNTIKIEITNQWTNRLIGDENYPNVSGYELSMDKMPDWYINNEPANLGERSTFTVYPFYGQGDELIPAGLIGPVRIIPSVVQLLEP